MSAQVHHTEFHYKLPKSHLDASFSQVQFVSGRLAFVSIQCHGCLLLGLNEHGLTEGCVLQYVPTENQSQ